jgi:HEAT repeat protein
LVRRLKDDASFVRWEAALSLQRIHNPVAIDPLMTAAAKDEDPDVRMAAAYALGQYAEPPVFDVLVGALDDPEYAVVQNAQGSLQTLTGQKLDADGAQWLAFKKEHPGKDLFKNQKQYLWQPFTKPKGTLDYVKFWKKKPVPQPAPPVGATAKVD